MAMLYHRKSREKAELEKKRKFLQEILGVNDDTLLFVFKDNHELIFYEKASGVKLPIYHWIDIPTSVIRSHFYEEKQRLDKALKDVEQPLEYSDISPEYKKYATVILRMLFPIKGERALGL